MRTVLKVVIPVEDGPHDVPMPLGARIVHVACQGSRVDEVCVWFECESDTMPAERRFVVHGTNHEVVEPYPDQPIHVEYVGTAVVASGLLVWHLFEHQRLAPIELPVSPEEVLGESQPDPRLEPPSNVLSGLADITFTPHPDSPLAERTFTVPADLGHYLDAFARDMRERPGGTGWRALLRIREDES